MRVDEVFARGLQKVSTPDPPPRTVARAFVQSVMHSTSVTHHSATFVKSSTVAFDPLRFHEHRPIFTKPSTSLSNSHAYEYERINSAP